MFSHAPKDYKCPICLGVKGVESEDTMLKQADLVYRDDLVSVFINSFWIETTEGHVIVVPNEHYENLYELPQDIGHRVAEVTQLMAKTMKEAYGCDGITIRQNNEPAGGQHAFHYHQHVYPRYDGDQHRQNAAIGSIASKPEDRIPYAGKLKSQLEK